MAILSYIARKAHFQYWRFLLIRHEMCYYWTRSSSQKISNSQRSLDTCLLVMVQESIPSRCIFSYLELHYYNHWSYIELYIWSTAWSLVIISIGGSFIHLVIQEIIILWNKQNTNDIVNNISGIKSKYFSHEPPTPNQFVFCFLKDHQD